MEYKDPEYKQPAEQFKDLFKNEDRENAVKVSCSSCGSKTPAANINLERLLAKCDACDSVFSVEEKLSQLEKTAKPKAEIDHMPEGIEFAEFSDGIEIRAKLKTANPPMPWIVLLGAILLFFLFLTYLLIVTKEPVPIAAPIFVGSVGIVTIMGIIHHWMKWKNAAHISVDDYQLVVDFPGIKKDYKIDVDRIEKVYSAEAGVYAGLNGERRMMHHIFVKEDNGIDRVLFKMITREKQATFIVQEINRYLDKTRSHN